MARLFKRRCFVGRFHCEVKSPDQTVANKQVTLFEDSLVCDSSNLIDRFSKMFIVLTFTGRVLCN